MVLYQRQAVYKLRKMGSIAWETFVYKEAIAMSWSTLLSFEAMYVALLQTDQKNRPCFLISRLLNPTTDWVNYFNPRDPDKFFFLNESFKLGLWTECADSVKRADSKEQYVSELVIATYCIGFSMNNFNFSLFHTKLSNAFKRLEIKCMNHM